MPNMAVIFFMKKICKAAKYISAVEYCVDNFTAAQLYLTILFKHQSKRKIIELLKRLVCIVDYDLDN